MEIKERSFNQVLEREEVKFVVEHEGGPTPSREEIRRALCAQLNVDPSLLLIKRIMSSFGSAKSAGIAHVYKDKERMLKVEPKHLLKRDKLIE